MSKLTYVVFYMDKRERLDEFVRRLLAEKACESFEEAFDLLASTLVGVENEFSGIPFDAAYPRDDGRMYPPKEDAYRSVSGRPDLRRYRSVAHNTYFGDAGAILIVDLDNNVLLDKPDNSGRRIIL